jgi:hypothetical protein
MKITPTTWAALALLAFATAARAQNPIFVSPDTTAQLGVALPPTLADDDAARDDGAGNVTPVLLTMLGAALPTNAEIAGLELSTNSAPRLALDVTTPLPGLPVASPAEPRDVVRWDPNTSSYALDFDGSANGVPAGVRIDAVSLNAANDLLLSFDTTVSLPGLGIVDDEDLVRFAGGIYTLVFDGSANGVAAGLDLDAASRPALGSNLLLLSFDGSGNVGAVGFDDEDTLLFDPGSGAWAMFADASLSDPADWPRADASALPEPGAAVTLATGAVALTLLARRRR